MQMITDFFNALSRIFGMFNKAAATTEKLLNQTAYNLDTSEREAKYKAIASRKQLQKDYKITDKEIEDFDADFWN